MKALTSFSGTRFNLPHSNIVCVYIASFKNISFIIYLLLHFVQNIVTWLNLFLHKIDALYGSIYTSLSRNKYYHVSIVIYFSTKIIFLFFVPKRCIIRFPSNTLLYFYYLFIIDIYIFLRYAVFIISMVYARQ